MQDGFPRPVLTNIDVEVRGRGTRLLSSVLQTATSLTLNEVEGTYYIVTAVYHKWGLLENILTN